MVEQRQIGFGGAVSILYSKSRDFGFVRARSSSRYSADRLELLLPFNKRYMVHSGTRHQRNL